MSWERARPGGGPPGPGAGLPAPAADRPRQPHAARTSWSAPTDKVVKLADLMLAKAMEGSRLQEAVLEQKLLAELPYLAPEQIEPDAFVDHLADLYALGAVVYALLAGRPPFGGDLARGDHRPDPGRQAAAAVEVPARHPAGRRGRRPEAAGPQPGGPLPDRRRPAQRHRAPGRLRRFRMPAVGRQQESLAGAAGSGYDYAASPLAGKGARIPPA